jgi:hypothetical protein
MRPQLDPTTGNRVDAIEDGPLLTYEEASGISVPCPSCGAPVGFAPIDMGDKETVGSRRCRIGRHTFSCRCYSPEVV